MFVAVETLVGQAIEPLLYGHSTGLSPIAVVVAATFWTWLWGPIGLVMATPLTVCLVVLGRHVERLRFLEVMLGDRPALSPPEIFYQRMLAGDPAEAADHAQQFLKKRTLLTYYEAVAMDGLRLAQGDIAGGLLNSDQTATIVASANEVVDELAAEDDVPVDADKSIDLETQAAVESELDEPGLPGLAVDARRADWGLDAVVCVAGTDEMDDVAGRIFAQLLDKHGLPAKVLPPTSLRSADLFRLDLSGARWICVSFVDAASGAHIRHAVRKLRRKAPSATIVVGAWSIASQDIPAIALATPDATIVRTLRDGLKLALSAATVPQPDTNQSAKNGPAPLLRTTA